MTSDQRNRKRMPGGIGFLVIGALSVVAAALLAAAVQGRAEEMPSPAGVRKIPFPKPSSHNANWIEYHGALADVTQNEMGQDGTACYVCHRRNDCIECHNTMMPRDHTNTWRNLSHGFQASGNRDRCLNCHKQDYCVRCHNETAPRSHVAGWTARHCTWCHFGTGITPADNCVVCHKRAPHTSAPPAPHPPIGASTTCIQPGCHTP